MDWDIFADFDLSRTSKRRPFASGRDPEFQSSLGRLAWLERQSLADGSREWLAPCGDPGTVSVRWSHKKQQSQCGGAGCEAEVSDGPQFLCSCRSPKLRILAMRGGVCVVCSLHMSGYSRWATATSNGLSCIIDTVCATPEPTTPGLRRLSHRIGGVGPLAPRDSS